MRSSGAKRPGRGIAAAAAVLLLLQAGPACAYIGPGAGFAFFSSIMVFALSFVAALGALLLLPLRLLVRALKRSGPDRGARRKVQAARKAVVVGLDGLSPDLVRRYMEEGLLPNFARLAGQGTFVPLGTTTPPISPVAWSSFSTGCNPGRHNIFDFLSRDPRTYMPVLSSARVETPARTLKLGPYRIPLSRPSIRAERRGPTLWGELGRHGVPSAVIRVPITFPADRFQGRLLSSMGVPDLRGTQGTFSFYCSDGTSAAETGGERHAVRVLNNKVKAWLIGPDDSLRDPPRPTRVPFTVVLEGDDAARLTIQGNEVRLRTGAFSPWVPVTFRMSLGIRVRGMVRFYLREVRPRFALYASPVNVDPEKPVLPIAHPLIYSLYLSRTTGRFATLGLAEDTWALNQGALDDAAFLEQCYLHHEERERMLFQELTRFRRGLLCCVFDTPDRVQHMFWRRIDPRHPLHGDGGPDHTVFRELYRRMDDLVGRVLERIDEETLLLVMSDHGFGPFRRGVDLNTWLRDQGLLVMEGGSGATAAELFAGVDWSRTRAYALGLSGIYLNLRGREARGVVAPGAEAEEIKERIARELPELVDPETGERPVARVMPREDAYRGANMENAPDLIVLYNEGYRASWESVMGGVSGGVVQPNPKAWSGDHSRPPAEIPGVLFSNRRVEAVRPGITDLAPTLLGYFGVPVPLEMDGRCLPLDEAGGTPAQRRRS